MFITLPDIGTGTIEQQVSKICSYIYQNNEQINLALNDINIEKFWKETEKALRFDSDSTANKDITAAEKEKYNNLRALIINTADTIVESNDTLNMVLQGDYVAKGQLGEYLRHTTLEIDGDSQGITELFTYTGANRLGEIYQKNYIKQGLLDETGPIYGIEIGLISSEFISQGVTRTEEKKKIRITPDRLGLWDENSEVAYINSGKIFFPEAIINGGSINIGNGNFIVNSSGSVSTAGDIQLGNKFHIDTSGNIFADDIKINNIFMNTGVIEANSVDFKNATDRELIYGYIGNSPSNNKYGFDISMRSAAEFFRIGTDTQALFLYSKNNGYGSGYTEGLYSGDGNGTMHKTITGTVNIGGANMKFVNGLYCGSGS